MLWTSTADGELILPLVYTHRRLDFNQEIRISMASLRYSGLRVIPSTHTSHTVDSPASVEWKAWTLAVSSCYHPSPSPSAFPENYPSSQTRLRRGGTKIKKYKGQSSVICLHTVGSRLHAERWEGWRYYLFSFFSVLLHCCAFSTPGHYERFRMKGADERYNILWGCINYA